MSFAEGQASSKGPSAVGKRLKARMKTQMSRPARRQAGAFGSAKIKGRRDLKGSGSHVVPTPEAQQQQGTCQKCTFLGPNQDSLNQKLWVESSNLCFYSHPVIPKPAEVSEPLLQIRSQ